MRRRSSAAAVTSLCAAFLLGTVIAAVPPSKGTIPPPTAANGGHTPRVTATGGIPRPPWWRGTCDGSSTGAFPGSYPLGASWAGLVACGPGSNQDPPGGEQAAVSFFKGAWGEYEWQCVELSMRWMYLAWGVPPYPADGDDIVDNYARYNPNGPKLTVVRNGTPREPPLPGDVLELTDGDSYGHTEVVTGSFVNSRGNGTIEAITQNLNAPSDGWYQLSVKNWVVRGGFGEVVDWLHNPDWSLEEPLVSKLSATGDLFLKVDELKGRWAPLAAGVVEAEVVGGGGIDPQPLVAVLTKAGHLEVGEDLPGASLRTIATGVTQIAASSSEGRSGAVTVGWLTARHDFYLLAGNLEARPRLEATHVASIAVASDAPAHYPVVGYVSTRRLAYLRRGRGRFVRIASGVRSLVLADAGSAGSLAVQGYLTTAGAAYDRQGWTSSFQEIAPPARHDTIRDLAVATVGPSATPLVADVTSSGEAYAELGSARFVPEHDHAVAVAVASTGTTNAFPILAVRTSRRLWLVKDGTLSTPFVSEGPSASLGLGALDVP